MVEKWPQKSESKNNITDALANSTNNSLNSSLNTINIAKVLPCNTTEEILESVFDKKETFWEPIDSILNKPFSIESFLKSQEEEDALTDLIYKKENKDGEEMINFPQKIKKSNTPPHLWKIWEQTSKYHKETVPEHIAMVIAWVSEDTDNDLNMQLVALLHDAWKKYTGWTNKIWDICFFGHEKVSAYLAATIYRQLWFTKEEAEPYIRIIHDHMLPFSERTQNKEKKDKYRELHWDYITNGITTLNENDLWITQEDENNPELKTQKTDLIERWNNILKDLQTKNPQRK